MERKEKKENIKLYLNESFSYRLQYVYFSYTHLDI